MVKNHIFFKTGFEYNVIRRTSFQACQRVRPPVLISQLQGHFQDRRVIVPLPSSSSSSPTVTSSGNETREGENRIESDISPVTVSTKVDDRTGQPDETQANKIPKTHKKRSHRQFGATRCVLKSRSGCKNSGKMWWMIEFLNTETHTPVLLMKYL